MSADLLDMPVVLSIFERLDIPELLVLRVSQIFLGTLFFADVAVVILLEALNIWIMDTGGVEGVEKVF